MRILICDDSGMARKQAARSLPPGFATDIAFAEHGAQALEVLAAQPIDLLLLDLTMPVMDGFETLAAIREQQIKCGVIVISGDIQPQARERVVALGALDFIQKPIDTEKLHKTLCDYGFISSAEVDSAQSASGEAKPPAAKIDLNIPGLEFNELESLKEVSNIAMGDAAARLAQLLKTFIHLPIPNVAWLSASELQMALGTFQLSGMTVVSQGFVSRGFSGEAILYADSEGVAGLQKLVAAFKSLPDENDTPILGAATVLIGAFLTRLGREMDLSFSKSQPIVLTKSNLNEEYMIESSSEEVLLIEIPYEFSELSFGCDLMIMLPKRSGEILLARVKMLMQEDAE